MKSADISNKLIRYERIIEISRDLASTLDLDTLLDRILRVALELSSAETGSILLYDEKKNELMFQAVSDASSKTKLTGVVVPVESLAGWVAENRQPIIVADVHQDSRWFNQVEKKLEYPTHSLIAVPMIAKQKLIGVLEVLNKKEGAFSAEDQEILMVLAANAAIAIENAHLFQKSDLISELVHELRTPLTAITSLAYLLQKQQIDMDERIHYARTILQEAKRLDSMASNFLDLARLESKQSVAQKESFSFLGLVSECDQVIRSSAVEMGIQLSFAFPNDLPQIYANRNQIKQVLLNLLSNAIKFSRPGSQISISAQSHKNEFCFWVQDTGKGVAESDIQHLFEKFFRTCDDEKNTPGTGLGLYITKRIVENHGGTIQVESQTGRGSKFTVILPACENEPQ